MQIRERVKIATNWAWRNSIYSLALFSFLIWGLGLVDASPAADVHQDATSKGMISILRKLEFSKVGFSVKSHPRYEQALRDRALARLKASGLEPVKATYKGPVEALLVLTLNPIPLSDSCPGKVLYDRKLQLLEDITVRRDPGIHLQAETWFLGPAVPSVDDSKSLETLLSDVDWYIDRFIASYGLPPTREEK